jgi:predicted dehydrogenase
MVRHAREMVANGELGRIRLVHAEYVQDWLTNPIEQGGQKQAEWRTDPARSGAGGSVGDIGTHAYNLACFVSGLDAESLAADLTSFVEGRRLDDNCHVMLRYPNGARGMIWATQVAPGNENRLTLGVYGTTGGLQWTHDDPNQLWFHAVWRTEAADHTRRRRSRPCRGARHPRPPGPSGRLPRRLRQHLCRSGSCNHRSP